MRSKLEGQMDISDKIFISSSSIYSELSSYDLESLLSTQIKLLIKNLYYIDGICYTCEQRRQGDFAKVYLLNH